MGLINHLDNKVWAIYEQLGWFYLGHKHFDKLSWILLFSLTVWWWWLVTNLGSACEVKSYVILENESRAKGAIH